MESKNGESLNKQKKQSIYCHIKYSRTTFFIVNFHFIDQNRKMRRSKRERALIATERKIEKNSTETISMQNGNEYS